MIKKTGYVRVWLANNGTINFSYLMTKEQAYDFDKATLKKEQSRGLIGIKKVNIVEGCGLKNYKFPVRYASPT